MFDGEDDDDDAFLMAAANILEQQHSKPKASPQKKFQDLLLQHSSVAVEADENKKPPAVLARKSGQVAGQPLHENKPEKVVRSTKVAKWYFPESARFPRRDYQVRTSELTFFFFSSSFFFPPLVQHDCELFAEQHLGLFADGAGKDLCGCRGDVQLLHLASNR
jgi:hypothetical protein